MEKREDLLMSALLAAPGSEDRPVPLDAKGTVAPGTLPKLSPDCSDTTSFWVRGALTWSSEASSTAVRGLRGHAANTTSCCGSTLPTEESSSACCFRSLSVPSEAQAS